MPTTTSADRAPLLRIERDELLKLEKSLTREWLETNGLGGFASSTVLACATRRYHGLLVTPFDGTVQRHVFLSRFEETLHGDGRSEPISIARYGGCFAPHGHRSIESFELRPWPRTTYRIGGARVIREVLMPKGRQAVLVRYSVEPFENDRPDELRLRPVLACRAADSQTFENLVLDPRARRFDGGVAFRPYEALPELVLSTSVPDLRFEADPLWHTGVEYPVEIERGYGGHEDLFSPGTYYLDLTETSELTIAASIDGWIEDPGALFERESEARALSAGRVTRDVRGLQSLVAEDFLYEDQNGNGRKGIVAGWPWFLEWGRDTYLSLPGLTLARGQVERCGDILEGALPWLSNGLLPNIFGKDEDDSHYGSVDAALWFVRAVRLYDIALGEDAEDNDVAARFLPALREIATSYGEGACGFVVADASGLIRAGRPDLNATWMDARASDGPVTPRDGFAVEIDALWCFLLRYLELLELRAGESKKSEAWGALRRKAYDAFRQMFWMPDHGYLADTVKDGVADAAVRPNMVLAAALEFSPLSREQRASIVEVADRELLTPRGLRTLSPKNAEYEGRYFGDQDTRDRAYHQGTVWPWLLGGYVEATLRAFGRDAKRVVAVRRLLDGFDEHLLASGQLHVSEVFDGDPPHRPGGTIAQAWSCAEILRSYWLLEQDASIWSDRTEESSCVS